MDLTPYISNLREDLQTTASAGDEQTRQVAAVLAAALEPSMRLALMNALSDLAAEVTSHLDEHVVDVRLDGKDVRVVVSGSPHDTADIDESEPPPPPPPSDSGDISRMTLRLFEEIKSKAEQAAAAQGVSLNTFVQQAVQGALRGKGSGPHRKSKPGDGGSSLRGWVRG